MNFKSLVIRPGEEKTLQSSETCALVISNACIPDISAGPGPSRLFASVSNQRILLTTLVPGLRENDMLNFKVPLESIIKLEVVGAHPVHVIGYLNSLVDEALLEEEEEEETEE